MVTRRASSTTRDGKRTRRGPFTRQQILDASLSLFSQRGFARTTVRDIARKAGITDAAIYYHFDSKREVLAALVEERGFLTSLQELAEAEPIVNVEAGVQWIAAGAVNMMDENRDFLRLIIMEGLGGDEAALEQYMLLINLWEKALTAVFGRYEAKGEIPPGSAADLATQVPYLILAAFQDSLLGRHGFSGSAEDRRAALRRFLGPSLVRLIRGALA